MVDDRDIEEAWGVGYSALIPEKSKESNNNIARRSVSVLLFSTYVDSRTLFPYRLAYSFPFMRRKFLPTTFIQFPSIHTWLLKHPGTASSTDLPTWNHSRNLGNPDILICGNCREMFTELQELLDHKKTYCKLRFTCKCHTLNGVKTKSSGEELSSTMLLCVLCKDSFQSAWDLMVHVQAAHMMNIYELGVPKSDNANYKNEQTSQQNSPPASPSPTNDKEGGPDVQIPVDDEKKKKRVLTPTQDDDVVEISCGDNVTSPEKVKDEDEINNANHDKELEELMAVESTAQACIMHALRIEQSSGTNQNSGSVASDQPPVVVSITNGELSAQE
ncbi:hypothetical protein L9F63_024938 [Diploptera punctata]|uniref:C2H2-type domain-containing protein n=1 Tax=Diploptera punctata TaxID=6984 RepID=A0AAD8E6U6_DIPPU|nr:hypothetical protein L9F63_024938 [Diploptera punctata]